MKPYVWYHGSPEKLTTLKPGSYVTPFAELAKAYSHKPAELSFAFTEDTDKDEILVEVEQNGRQTGFLYQVTLQNPEADLRPSVEKTSPLGEEMVTVKEQQVKCIESEIQPEKTYAFKIAMRSF
ncbi:hypothetical protein CSA37_09250 [Candidatus Fermentibacteria bacterium]|nr:MAG: hypothetical protein CSA37_09250 [Candidatus Fermentibacteria bacterium]